MDFGTYMTVFSLITGLSGFIAAGVMWYRGIVRQQYAAERNSAHMLRHQEQLQESFKLVFDELEALNRTLIEVKVLVMNQR